MALISVDFKTPWTLEIPGNSKQSMAPSWLWKKNDCWMHSAFKFICHRNAPVLSYSILSWDLLLMPAVLSSCDGVQTCPCKPRWTMGYPLVWHPPGKVVPPKGQNSHSQLLWLMQCGMVLNIASQLINHSCSQVTFPSSVLQLFPLASLCQSSSRQIKKKSHC